MKTFQNIKKPIVFFDLETTGLDALQDKVCQISLIKVIGDTKEKIETLINPGIHIPESVTAIHGITDEMVSGAPYFKDIAADVATFLKDCDIAGYNIIYFDLPLLIEELGRCNREISLEGINIIDVCLIYKKMRPRTLTAAYMEFTGRNREDAHDATADTLATIEVFDAMVERENIGDTPEAWMDYTVNRKQMVDLAGKLIRGENGDILLNFGPHKGEKVVDNMGMLKWMIGKNFPRDTMNWVNAIMDDSSVAYGKTSTENDVTPLPFG